jgi:hypothetical protein
MPGRQGPGRPGPDRPAQPPPGRRRQRAGRGGQGPGPHPPEPGLDPPTAGQPAPQPAAGVLPGGAGRLRHRGGQPRRPGRPPGGADPHPGPAALTGHPGRCPRPRRPSTRRPGKGGAAPSRPPRPQLQAPTIVADAYGAAVKALVEVIGTLNRPLEQVVEQLQRHVEIHPDAEIVGRLPGLGVVLGARVVAEFGDDPTRYGNPKARKNNAGTAPITRASGNARSWWPGGPATGGWLMPVICGRSRPLAPRQARVPTTTGYEPPGPPINRPCGPWPTA